MIGIVFAEVSYDVSGAVTTGEPQFLRKLPDGNSALQHNIRLMQTCGIEPITIITNDDAPKWADDLPSQVRVEFAKDPHGQLKDRSFLERLAVTEEHVIAVSAEIVFTNQLLTRLIGCKRSAVVAHFTSEHSKAVISGHSVVAYGENTVLMRPVKQGVEASFEVEGVCYPFYKLLYTDIERWVRYLAKENAKWADSTMVIIGRENNVNVRILNAEQEELLRLTNDVEDEQLRLKSIEMQMRDQMVVAVPRTAEELRKALQDVGLSKCALIYDEMLRENPFLCQFKSNGIVSAEIEWKETLDAEKCIEILRNCDCIISVGGLQVQRFAHELRTGFRPSVLYHVSIPFSDAIHEAIGTNSKKAPLQADMLIYNSEIDETDCNIKESAICALVDSLGALLSTCSEGMILNCARKAYTYAAKSIFSHGEKEEDCCNSVYAQLWAARLKLLNGETVLDGIREGLCSIGVPVHQASLIACAGYIRYLQSHLSGNSSACGRCAVADALDEIGNLMRVMVTQISQTLGDLLYLTGWDGAAFDLRPNAEVIEHYVTADQQRKALMAVDNTSIEEILGDWFQGNYSMLAFAQTQISDLERRGYNCHCVKKATSYKAFLKMRFEAQSLYAKDVLQKTFLEIFDAVKLACEELGLRYMLVGSALLSAVWEGKLLPTVNSFEIAMPQKDLEKLVCSANKLGDAFHIASSHNDKDCTFAEARVYRKDTVWFRLHNLHAVGQSKEIYITILPLSSAAGTGHGERLRFRIAKGVSLILTHKRGEHHRAVGWKGDFMFRLGNRIPSSWLVRFCHRLRKPQVGDFYLCYCDRKYEESRIRKKLCFTGKELLLEGRRAAVPEVKEYLYTRNEFENRRFAKQNNFLMPGTYLLRNDTYGAIEIMLAQPPQKNVNVQPLLRLLRKRVTAYIKATPQRLTRRWKRLKTKLRKKTKELMRWYKKSARPKSKAWMRTQFVRITGSLRGMGICFSPNAKLLRSYRNKYVGQRCFLIGNGPSLRAEDLDLLQDEVTMGCNFIHKIYAQTQWRPTYHFISDSSTVRTASWDFVKNLDQEKTTMFIREFAYKFMYVKPDHAVLVPYISTDHYKVRGNFLAYHYISHATVMSMMLEAAFYMGFKEIYLLGVDGTTASSQGGNFIKNYFSPEQRTHMDKLKKNAIQNYDVFARRRAIQERQIMVYQCLRDYADAHGIRIYNATRGGALEVFERVDFEQIVGGEST